MWAVLSLAVPPHCTVPDASSLAPSPCGAFFPFPVCLAAVCSLATSVVVPVRPIPVAPVCWSRTLVLDGHVTRIVQRLVWLVFPRGPRWSASQHVASRSVLRCWARSPGSQQLPVSSSSTPPTPASVPKTMLNVSLLIPFHSRLWNAPGIPTLPPRGAPPPGQPPGHQTRGVCPEVPTCQPH